MPSSRSTQNYNYCVRQEAKFDRIVTVLLCVDKKKCRWYMCYIALFPSARLWNIKIYDHKRKQGQKKSLNREKHQRCSMISYVCQPPSLLQRNTNSTLHLDSLDPLWVLFYFEQYHDDIENLYYLSHLSRNLPLYRAHDESENPSSMKWVLQIGDH